MGFDVNSSIVTQTIPSATVFCIQLFLPSPPKRGRGENDASVFLTASRRSRTIDRVFRGQPIFAWLNNDETLPSDAGRASDRDWAWFLWILASRAGLRPRPSARRYRHR